jgi:hypothetical protein
VIVTLAAVAVVLASGGSALASTPASGSFADLDPAIAAALPAGAGAGEILDASILSERAFRFDVGVVTAWTDSRWYGVASAPRGEAGVAPVLELRRWPGDSLIAFYALPTEPFPTPPGADLGPPREGTGAWVLRGGNLETDGERRRVLWASRSVGGEAGRCGVLLVPGDAGLGERSIAEREAELLAILERSELPEEAWRRSAPFPAGPLLLPVLPPAPRRWDEGADAWQAVEGPGFTLGLPPGVLGRRLDTGVTAPSVVAGAGIWFRGRFVDRDGVEVAIGDERRAGYAIEFGGELAGWRAGSVPPAGAPAAIRLDRIPLERAAVEGTGARSGWVASFSEPGFGGTWLVFGLDFEERAVEIGIPVLEGRRSLALFWIPVTWRDAPRPPAPPPIDPASRFGIRFEQTSRLERSRRGQVEGTLVVPGLRLELPRGWWPSATLRSADGFPVLLVDESGEEMGRLERIPAGPPLRALIDGASWTERPGARSRGATAIYQGPGATHLFIAPEGHAWKLATQRPGDPGWGRVVDSVALGKSRPGGNVNGAERPPS